MKEPSVTSRQGVHAHAQGCRWQISCPRTSTGTITGPTFGWSSPQRMRCTTKTRRHTSTRCASGCCTTLASAHPPRPSSGMTSPRTLPVRPNCFASCGCPHAMAAVYAALGVHQLTVEYGGTSSKQASGHRIFAPRSQVPWRSPHIKHCKSLRHYPSFGGWLWTCRI